jgi:hypothetical protein
MSVMLPIVWFATTAWGSPDALAQMNWPSSPEWNVFVPLLAPGLMGRFYFLHAKKLQQDKGLW